MSANPTPDATATPRTDADKLATELIVWSSLPLGAGINQYEFSRVAREAAKLLRELPAAKAQLRERTQWQCKCGGTDCAGQAENERLRAEVTKLKAHEGDLVIGAAILEGARKQEAREVDQLRARVAELESDKARLDWLAREPYPRMSEVRSLMALTGYPTAEAKDLIRAAIDAARDGKGAT